MKYGTSYFESRLSAYVYFSRKGGNRACVNQKIKDGEIHIGKPLPLLRDNETITLDLEEGRYFIEDK